MAYIIENAHILRDKELTTCSLLINKAHITAVHGSFKQYRLMKMKMDEFLMTPSYVLLNSTISPEISFKEMKKIMIEQFLFKGCTTLFTYVSVSYEDELARKMEELKTSLHSCPIDFIIGVKIPVRLLTPVFIRKCKKENIPAIFVELAGTDELERIPWGWVKDAMFPFNGPLIPIISCQEKKEVRTVLSKWKDIMIYEKIPALHEEIAENEPLSRAILNKIGLYPERGSLMNGTECSYNLYYKGREIKNVDWSALFHYHSDRLVVTVHKGKIIRTDNEILFKPGFGEYVKVRTPSFFSF